MNTLVQFRAFLLVMLYASVWGTVESRAQMTYACPLSCRLPDCHCASTEPPGGISRANAPQFILITFDDCVNTQSDAPIRALVDSLRNPDGRQIPVTYFVSAANCPVGGITDTALVRHLYRQGNEMAAHTFTHTTSNTSSYSTWNSELEQIEGLLRDAGVPHERLGFRAPYIQTNSALFDVLAARRYRYDSSILDPPFWSPVTRNQSTTVWPHTLDYRHGQQCGFAATNQCGTTPRPGLWTIPVWMQVSTASTSSSIQWYGSFDLGFPLFSGTDWIVGEALRTAFLETFYQRYQGNRAPYSMYMHAPALVDPARRTVIREALRTMLQQPNTWVVTMEGLIHWMRNPVPAVQMSQWYTQWCTNRPCELAPGPLDPVDPVDPVDPPPRDTTQIAASTLPPAGLPVAQTPQFVLLSFDDCVNATSHATVSDLMQGLRNPDGRNIAATFFLSAEDCTLGTGSSPQIVAGLYQRGSEMASHSWSHRTNEATSEQAWHDELERMEQFLQLAGVPHEGLGFRAPGLRTNPALFRVLRDRGYRYDASVLESPFGGPVSRDHRNVVWPHTLHEGHRQSCGFLPHNVCAEVPKPRLWTFPKYIHTSRNSTAANPVWLGSYDLGDPIYSGQYPGWQGDGLRLVFDHTFDVRYRGNRAPYTMFMHAASLVQNARRAVVRQSMQDMLAKPDVWFITMEGLIAWMQNPVPSSEMSRWFDAWCSRRPCQQDALVVSTEDQPDVPSPSLTAYPNPVRDRFIVSRDEALPTAARLRVFDVLGRQVSDAFIAPGTSLREQIDLTAYPPGPYAIRLEAADGTLIGQTRIVRL